MIKEIIPDSLRAFIYKSKQRFFGAYYFKSYSQEGEDMLLHRIFGNKKGGFYIDIGAHHPRRFSNTYFFYCRGWHGINIDAMPNSMELFKKERNRDINLEIALSEKEDLLTFFVFEEPAINSFNIELSEERIANGNKLLYKQEIKTRRLSDVLNEHLKQGDVIDFLSIDVEGMDLQILKSNNWEKFRPSVIAVECLNNDILTIQADPTYIFLNGLGYKLIAKTLNTCIFRL